MNIPDFLQKHKSYCKRYNKQKDEFPCTCGQVFALDSYKELRAQNILLSAALEKEYKEK